jgi:hypothetical protein
MNPVAPVIAMFMNEGGSSEVESSGQKGDEY